MYKKKGIRRQLKAAFESATSADEKLTVFKKMESRFQENELGLECWKMAQKFHDEDKDPLKIVSFGKRALNIYLNHSFGLDIHNSSLIIATILHLLGFASFELKRYDECLSYLNWSDRNLSKLLLEHSGNRLVLENLHNTHLELSRVKKVLGRGDEVVFHSKKVLEIGEKVKIKGCVELGWANEYVADAYLELKNYEEALPFGLKALEIFEKHMGDDSEEISRLRMSLGEIYSGLEEHEKALEQYRLCLSGLQSMGDPLRLIMAEVARGQILVTLGRYKEAIEALKPVISRAETAGTQRLKAVGSMVMAEAFFRQEKFVDAIKYIKMAQRILEKKGLDPNSVATGFMKIAKLYEEMKEYEAAILLVQKALNIPELPELYLVNCSFRLFSLVSLTGTEKDRLSLLEEVVERLKKISGPEHCHVGYAYGNLGDVYLYLGRPEMAAGCFLRAKHIFDVALGPYHFESLTASHSLSVAYMGMNSYDLAIENQEKVVIAFQGLGQTEQDGANKAVQLLDIIKQRDIGQVADSHARSSHQSEDGEDFCAADSKGGVSNDGKVI